jgi:hypothetical protein
VVDQTETTIMAEERLNINREKSKIKLPNG